jgi:hypothetical protein
MVQPPKLAAFLDYGGELATFPGLEGLAEAVIVRRRLNTAEQNRTEERFFRDAVQRWLADGPAALEELLDGCACGTPQVVVTAFSWAAECYADPALAERFERSIPPDLFAENIGWANERKVRAARTSGA